MSLMVSFPRLREVKHSNVIVQDMSGHPSTVARLQQRGGAGTLRMPGEPGPGPSNDARQEHMICYIPPRPSWPNFTEDPCMY